MLLKMLLMSVNNIKHESLGWVLRDNDKIIFMMMVTHSNVFMVHITTKPIPATPFRNNFRLNTICNKYKANKSHRVCLHIEFLKNWNLN